jgi:SAM-dependent methyltransferase
MDSAAVKAHQHDTWKSVAPGWQRWAPLLRRYSAPITEKMIAGLKPGQRVLDIASGVGDPAITIAKKVAPGGSVLGTDLVEEMLAYAREQARAAGVTNVEFRCVDGERLDVPAASFDAVTMRFGLMFMPDAVECLKRVREALKPGGSIAVVVWRAPDQNLWASIPIAVLKRHVDVPAPPPGAPGLFAFADRARLESVIREAGFADVRIDGIEMTMSDFETGDEFVQFTFELSGPLAALRNKVPETNRAAVDEEIAREVVAAGGGRAALSGRAWLAAATKTR